MRVDQLFSTVCVDCGKLHFTGRMVASKDIKHNCSVFEKIWTEDNPDQLPLPFTAWYK